METQPFYRLKTLIDDKYKLSGNDESEKFNSACAIVAGWVRHNTGLQVFDNHIKELCSITTPTPFLNEAIAAELKSLFKLNSVRELFTLPETANFSADMLKKKVSDIIICTTIGGITKYVLRAPINDKRIRIPVFIEDPEKAQRFWTEQQAGDYIVRFPKDKKKYTTETFAPAAEKNLV